MIEDGAYGILEPRDYKADLSELNRRLDENLHLLDSKFSTINLLSGANNGGLVIKADKNVSSGAIDRAESVLEDEFDSSEYPIEEPDIAVEFESDDLDNSYYSVRNLTGAFSK